MDLVIKGAAVAAPFVFWKWLLALFFGGLFGFLGLLFHGELLQTFSSGCVDADACSFIGIRALGERVKTIRWVVLRCWIFSTGQGVLQGGICVGIS
jgi:hypothetical protein